MTQILHHRHTPGYFQPDIAIPVLAGRKARLSVPTTEIIICQEVWHIYYTLVVVSVYELDLLPKPWGLANINTHNTALHLLHFYDKAVITF